MNRVIESIGFRLANTFKEVKFFDEDHSYMCKEKKLKSVTTVIKEFQQPFRSDYWATYKVIKNKGYKVVGDFSKDIPTDHIGIETKTKGLRVYHYSKVPNQYAGVKQIEALQEDWSEKGRTGREKGNYVHNFMENMYRGKIYKRDKFLESLFNPDLIPLSLEQILADLDYEIAGQADALFFNNRTKEIELRDYKTDKEIEKVNFFQKMKHPLNGLDDCNYNKYTLQLNVYRRMIEKASGVKIDRMYIHWIDYDNKKAELIEIPRMIVKHMLDVYHSNRNKSFTK